MQDQVFDELDLRLLGALQVAPRGSWAALARVVGADAVTLARRWDRLSGEGLAWVTGYPGGARSVGAIVEVDARTGRSVELAEAVGRDAEAMTIDVTSGSRDLILTIRAADAEALSRYLLDTLGTLDAVARVTSHPIASVLTDASQWRLRSLTPSEAARLERETRPAGEGRRGPQGIDAVVARELARDGRAPAGAIAEALDLPVRRVRETIAGLVSSGRVRLRTELVRSHSGWPVYAWYFLSLPAGQVERVGTQLGRIEEIRTVMSIVGPYNLAVAVWMRTLADVSRLEAAIEKQLPDVRIADRSVVLRTTKLVGQTLDGDGRRTGTVPVAGFV